MKSSIAGRHGENHEHGYSRGEGRARRVHRLAPRALRHHPPRLHADDPHHRPLSLLAWRPGNAGSTGRTPSSTAIRWNTPARPRQLLLGFLFALASSCRSTSRFFYLSMQDPAIASTAISGVALSSGFSPATPSIAPAISACRAPSGAASASTRSGNAWAYALRRFVWSILMVVTARPHLPLDGLEPLALSLAQHLVRRPPLRHRRQLASLRAALLRGLLRQRRWPSPRPSAGSTTPTTFVLVDDADPARPARLLALLLGCVMIFALQPRLVSRHASPRACCRPSRWARPSSPSTPRPAHSSASSSPMSSPSSSCWSLLASTALSRIGGIYASAAQKAAPPRPRCSTLFQPGTLNVALLIGVYLVVLGAFGLLGRAHPRPRLVEAAGARHARIANPDSLRTVQRHRRGPHAGRAGPRRRPQRGGVLMEFAARYQDGLVADVRDVALRHRPCRRARRAGRPRSHQPRHHRSLAGRGRLSAPHPRARTAHRQPPQAAGRPPRGHRHRRHAQRARACCRRCARDQRADCGGSCGSSCSPPPRWLR